MNGPMFRSLAVIAITGFGSKPMDDGLLGLAVIGSLIVQASLDGCQLWGVIGASNYLLRTSVTVSATHRIRVKQKGPRVTGGIDYVRQPMLSGWSDEIQVFVVQRIETENHHHESGKVRHESKWRSSLLFEPYTLDFFEEWFRA